jgi:hypothetical protein
MTSWPSCVLLGAYIAVLLCYVLFYCVTAFHMIRFSGQRKARPSGACAFIVMQRNFVDDIALSLDCSSISQFSSQTARGQSALGILASCTGLLLLFLTILSSSTSRYAVFSAFSYTSLLLVAIFQTTCPDGPEGMIRSFNDVLIFTLPSRVTRVFHIFGALTFLFLACFSNLIYCWQQDDAQVFIVLFMLQLLVNIVFLTTQGISMCMSSKYNWLWIMIECFSFTSTAVLYSVFQLTQVADYF